MRRILSLILVFAMVFPVLLCTAFAATIDQNWFVTFNESGDSGQQLFFSETDSDRILFTPTVKAAQLDGNLKIYEDIEFLQFVLRYDNFTPIVVDVYTGTADYQITFTYTTVTYENWTELTITVNCPTGYTNYPVNMFVDLIGNCKSLGQTTTFFVPDVRYTTVSGTTSSDDKVLEYWAWLSDAFLTLLNLLVDWWDDLKADMLNQYNGIVAAISTEVTRLSSDLIEFLTSWKTAWTNLYNGQLLPRFNTIISLLRGDSAGSEEMQEGMDSVASEATESLDILDGIRKPDPDDFGSDLEIGNLVDQQPYMKLAACLSPILNGTVFLPVFLMSLTLCLGAYVLFGKR